MWWDDLCDRDFKIIVEESSQVGFFGGSACDFVSDFLLDDKQSMVMSALDHDESEDGRGDVVG